MYYFVHEESRKLLKATREKNHAITFRVRGWAKNGGNGSVMFPFLGATTRTGSACSEIQYVANNAELSARAVPSTEI